MSVRPAVVLDNGAAFIKCGFGGDKFPSCVTPTVVAQPPISSSHHLNASPARGSRADAGREAYCCGERAIERRHEWSLSSPMKNNVITSIDDMERLWDHVFSDLLHLHKARGTSGSDPDPVVLDGGGLEERSLLLCEAPSFPMAHRARLFEVMFERYGFSHIQAAHQGVLTLFAAGLETGVAVECGEDATHCMPVFDGYPLTHAERRVHVGGADVTRCLARLLQKKGFPPSATFALRGSSATPGHARFLKAAANCRGFWNDTQVVRRIKERFCYTAVDRALEEHLALDTTALDASFLLPDGTPCTLGQERFKAAEVLFRPSIMDVDCPGLTEQLWESIQAADMDVRLDLYANMVLSGGNSLLPGLSTRLQAEMEQEFLERNLKGDKARLRTTRCVMHVEDTPQRKHMVFLGGALLAEQTMTQQVLMNSRGGLSAAEDDTSCWLSRQAWLEGGESALRARYGEPTTPVPSPV